MRGSTVTHFSWEPSSLTLTFAADEDGPVRLVSLAGPAAPAPRIQDDLLPTQPLVEVLAPRYGRRNNSYRFDGTELGAGLRYVTHVATTEPATDGRPGRECLEIRQEHPDGLVVTSRFELVGGAPAVRTATTVSLRDGAAPLTLWAVTSLATGAVVSEDIDDLDIWSARTGWSAENRWAPTPLRAPGLPSIDPGARGETSRNRIAATSTSTWSSGLYNPAGAAVARSTGRTLAWQIEHNGAWHWEVGEDPDWNRGAVPIEDRVRAPEPYGPPKGDRSHDGAYVALLGPEDADHQWSLTLTPDVTFTTVPVTVTVAASFEDALGNLATHRRAARRPHPVGDTLPVVFNDYMNTLEGDPTTAKLLPLVDAAARAGAEYFCIDAGWYDDSAGWWASVGDWRPSTLRFPDGFGAVVDHIRDRGMVPGVWLEPEVVGVTSTAAETLPDEAFLRRHGERIREHQRYFLDMRSPAARAHLDEAVDRLIAEFGIGYFKFDYNVTPGAGTDVGAESAGQGLLEHDRALLAWLGDVLDRHPDLVIENCGSGAMRSDPAMLGTLQLQSTSDQQDPLLYPAIAVGALAHVLPEQAGNWAYPQPTMSDEEIVFAMGAGLAGRLYLAGVLSGMDDDQLALVGAAVEAHQATKHTLARAVPRFPTGLPTWDDQWLSVAFDAGDETLLVVWRLPAAAGDVELALPHLGGSVPTVEQVYPPAGVGAPWSVTPTTAGLTIGTEAGNAQARMYRLTV
ncbi:alpha-galactosidase [Curtobacterium sp. MCBD17_013]|nr:alpha-galactosidase [Curtobacterium sp. MCBD17_013]